MTRIIAKTLTFSALAGTLLAVEAASAQAVAVAPAGSDHAAQVGHIGVGYLGRRGMSLGALNNEIQAPVIGVRYWLDEQMGLDLGLGLAINSQSSETSIGGMRTETDGPSSSAFILHGGVPLSLYANRHYSFQIVPELNLGFASGSEENVLGTMGTTDYSGFHIDVGARAGAEIHWGFIGIPELSLQGSVGLALSHDSVSAEGPPDMAGARTENKASRTNLGTNVGNSPWNVFTTNVAALYYF